MADACGGRTGVGTRGVCVNARDHRGWVLGVGLHASRFNAGVGAWGGCPGVRAPGLRWKEQY